MKITLAFCGPLIVAALLGAQTPTQGTAKTTTTATTVVNKDAVIATQKASYPLKTCVVSGDVLGADMGEPVDYVHDGRLVRLCCKMCIKEIEKAPADFFAKVDKAVIDAQKATYPLTTCPISGEKLGAMGEPVDQVQGTRLVRFCCKKCVAEFTKNPAPTMAKIDAALIEQQRASYPLKTCVISGEALDAADAKPVDYLYGTKLVRFCCKDCITEFNKNPEQQLAKLVAKPAAK